MSEGFLAAAATAVVTPAAGLPMGGYADRVGTSTGVLDDLEANLLWLQTPDTSLIWIALDALAVPAATSRLLADAVAARAGIDPGQVVITASHTHSGPAGWHGEIHPVLPADWDRSAVDHLVAQVDRAAGELDPQPVELSCGSAAVHGVGSHRHRQDLPCDNSLGAIFVTSGDSVRAVIFDYACHPTVLGPENRDWSADWVGAARRTIRARFGPVPVIFLQGAAGDISARFNRTGRGPDEVDRLGGIVGSTVLDCRPHSAPMTETALELQRHQVALPRRTPSDAHSTGSALSGVPIESGTGGRRLHESMAEGVRAINALQSSQLPGSLEFRSSRVRIGELILLCTPVELVDSHARRLRRHHRRVRVVGYTDDYLGYVADADGHAAGHYEALSSLLDLPTSERYVDALAALLDS